MCIKKGGVSKGITYGAGRKILKDYNEYLAANKELDYREILVTPAYNLKHNSSILHVRSPNINNTHFDTGLSINELIYYNLFNKSFIEMNTSSICTPLIGTGGMKISLSDSANDLLVALQQFLKENRSMLEKSAKKLFTL